MKNIIYANLCKWVVIVNWYMTLLNGLLRVLFHRKTKELGYQEKSFALFQLLSDVNMVQDDPLLINHNN